VYFKEKEKHTLKQDLQYLLIKRLNKVSSLPTAISSVIILVLKRHTFPVTYNLPVVVGGGITGAI
jgi:hypothetical protein